MIEKIKKIFTNKEKRVENLVSFLIILIITLIVINKILKGNEEKNNDYKNETGVELANKSEDVFSNNDFEKKLEKILEKIDGVGKVSVLITYSETSSVVPIYNINSSTSVTEETDTSGGTRKIETENNQKDIITDSNSSIVTEKVLSPKIEGAVITAKGASEGKIKSNIIDAVATVTGLPTHKIQVFEMGSD